jgi:hypothetical protein
VKRLQNELADVRAKQTERGWILTLKNELLRFTAPPSFL